MMNEEELKRITMESLKQAFSNNVVNEKVMPNDDLNSFFDNDECQMHFTYQFTTRDRPPNQGLHMIYHIKGAKRGVEFREAVTFFGGDEEISIRGAIDEFAHIDFPIINYFFIGDQEENTINDLEFSENMYYNPMQNPVLETGWKIVCSRLKKLDGTAKSYHLGETAQELYKALFAGLSKSLLPEPNPYLIKCWITRHKTLGMWADCRVNGQEWQEGADLLYDYAETWEMTAEEISMKQNLLLIPISINELSQEMQDKFIDLKAQTDEMNKQFLAQMQQTKPSSHDTSAAKQKEKPWWKIW